MFGVWLTAWSSYVLSGRPRGGVGVGWRCSCKPSPALPILCSALLLVRGVCNRVASKGMTNQAFHVRRDVGLHSACTPSPPPEPPGGRGSDTDLCPLLLCHPYAPMFRSTPVPPGSLDRSTVAGPNKLMSQKVRRLQRALAEYITKSPRCVDGFKFIWVSPR